MAQLSIPMKDTTLEKAVGLLFIASLIFSIGAAIQGLWALAWDHAFQCVPFLIRESSLIFLQSRAPDEHMPTLIVFWATHSPLVLMVASISSFRYGYEFGYLLMTKRCDSAGLVALCYAILDRAVFWVVLSITLFCASGFFITAMWSWAEWLVYRRHKGTKWLADILFTYNKQIWGSPLVEKMRYPGRRFYRHVAAGFKATAVTGSRLVTAFRSRSRRLEKQTPVLPTVVGGEIPRDLSGLVDAGPVVIKGEGARAPGFWSCSPNEQPVCLMLKVPRAHSDMIKCVSILFHGLSFNVDTF